jgi:hypothetical protein
MGKSMKSNQLHTRARRRGSVVALVVVLALFAAGCFSPGGPPVQRDRFGNPTARDAFAWPFASSSPWNMPIGRAAQYSAPGDPAAQSLLAATPAINAAIWSKPVVLASLGDPVRLVGWGPGAVAIHVPDSAQAAGPPGGDAHLSIVDPSRHVIDESWHTTRVFGNLASGFHTRVDLRGDGLTGATASGMSAVGGLIRAWELQALDIRHALAVAMPPQLMAMGPVWPAHQQDNFAASVYHGAIHMGSLLAIPPSVDVRSLGLSPQGTAIAYALQRYGAYVTDAGGTMALYAEPSAELWVRSARADMRRIQAQLRVVNNNGPGSVGGGGSPLAAFAPPFSN